MLIDYYIPYAHCRIHQLGLQQFDTIEQNRTDYLFDVNHTVSSQSNTIIIYISRSHILLEYLNQVVDTTMIMCVNRVCNCSMFCCTLLYVHSGIAIILMGKRELVALLNLSSWCLVMVERLFLAVPRVCQQFVIVVFPDHTHLLFLKQLNYLKPQHHSYKSI